jgi:hypothetical protein
MRKFYIFKTPGPDDTPCSMIKWYHSLAKKLYTFQSHFTIKSLSILYLGRRGRRREGYPLGESAILIFSPTCGLKYYFSLVPVMNSPWHVVHRAWHWWRYHVVGGVTCIASVICKAETELSVDSRIKQIIGQRKVLIYSKLQVWGHPVGRRLLPS